jgi:hypothetical protein
VDNIIVTVRMIIVPVGERRRQPIPAERWISSAE